MKQEKKRKLAVLLVIVVFTLGFTGCDTGGVQRPLPAPSSRGATALSSSTIQIRWGFIYHRHLVDYFRLERAFSPTGPWETVSRTSYTAFQDTGLPPDTIVFYRIFTVGNNAESIPSQTITARTQRLTFSGSRAPSAPTLVQATELLTTSCYGRIVWSSPYVGVEDVRFRFERLSPHYPPWLAFWSVCGIIAAESSIELWFNPPQILGTTLYRVVAVKGGMESAPSEIVQVTVRDN